MGKKNEMIKLNMCPSALAPQRPSKIFFWGSGGRGIWGAIAILLFICMACISFAAPLIQELFTSGQAAYEQGRYQDAINDFEAAIEIDNNFAPAYHALGLVYQKVSPDPSYPLWYFETALEIDPDFVPAYDMLCRLYYQVQEYVRAEEMCIKALKFNPELTGSQLSLAWIYLVGRSDPDMALYYFQQVIAKVKQPAIYFGMGMAYAMQGEHGKALDMVTYLRSQGGENFAAHLEAVLRSKTPREQFMPPGFLKETPSPIVAEADESSQPSVTAGGKEVVPVPMPIVVKPKFTGNPKIHVKGKIKPPTIKSITGQSQSKTYGGQDQKHPGSFSEGSLTED